MLLGDGKKRIPIGYEDFKEIIDEDLYYIDKTMLIYDLLKNRGKTSLITRPRRFGKTLNFSMLRYFFDITEKDSAYVFDGLKISEHYNELEAYKNTHPVISLSMKGAKRGDYYSALGSLCREIKDQFVRFDYIAKSDRLKENDRYEFTKILRSEPDAEIFGMSLKLLSSCLKQYYGANVIILIDAYDVPLEDAYFSDYYDKMVRFIRSLFESALKTNDALEFAVITGCLRISKESIFTGLNNLRSYSVLDKRYAEYFGFEEYEVKELLHYYGLDDKFELIKRWYDGYLFGDKEIYNPWSIMNYTDDLRSEPDKFPQSDWVNSSSNQIIRELVGSADPNTADMIEKLIHGGSIEAYLTETVTYGDIKSNAENIWSFLYFTGYLRVKSHRKTGDKALYELVIPNIEVKICYTDIIMGYFEAHKREIKRDELLNALLNGKPEDFAAPITKLLSESISFYDNTESFYHGLVAGLIGTGAYYKMQSNRETGNGRSDIAIYQQDRFINAIILEFKVCRPDEEITEAAKRALKQINEKDYAAEARSIGYKNIFKYGVAFKNKICYAEMEAT